MELSKKVLLPQLTRYVILVNDPAPWASSLPICMMGSIIQDRVYQYTLQGVNEGVLNETMLVKCPAWCLVHSGS